MNIRQIVPRECRRAFFNYGPRARFPRRAYATEIQRNDGPQTEQLVDTTSIGSSNATAPDVTTTPTAGRRRRRKVQPSVDPAVEAYLTFKQMQQTSGKYGTETSGYYAPHVLLANPPRPADVTLELLLASQAHLGHSTSLWNPANSRYIFGIREGIHIISLDVTAAHLRRAARVVSGVAERGGIILFVGTRAGFDRCVVRAAQLSGGCHLFERWTPGSITNGQQILGRCRMKVVDENDKPVSGFEEQLYEWPALKPDLVVCLNPLENRVLLAECAQANIPTIGIIDTDANPSWVTYPIPANDDSIRSVQVIAGVLGRAGQEGQQRRADAAKRGIITYGPSEALTLPVDWEEIRALQEAESATGKEHATNPASIQTPDNVSNHAPVYDDAAFFANNPDEELRSVIEKLNDEEKQALFTGTLTIEQLGALQDRLTEAEITTIAQTLQATGDRSSTKTAEDRDAEVTQELEELLRPLSAADQEGIAEALNDPALLEQRLSGLEGLLSQEAIARVSELISSASANEAKDTEGETENMARLQEIVNKLDEADREGLTQALDDPELLAEHVGAIRRKLSQEEFAELVEMLPGVALDMVGNAIVDDNVEEAEEGEQDFDESDMEESSRLQELVFQLSEEDRNSLVEAVDDSELLGERLEALKGKLPEGDVVELAQLLMQMGRAEGQGEESGENNEVFDVDNSDSAEPDVGSPKRRAAPVNGQMGADGENAPEDKVVGEKEHADEKDPQGSSSQGR